MAMRVPTPTGSVVDLTVELEKSASRRTTSTRRSKAAGSAPLQGIPLLHRGDRSSCRTSSATRPPASSTRTLTYEVIGNFVKVLGWYDNEWGYSNRTADLMKKMADLGL
jgi:glyceraldehyde 3-phosphate dehydrogenase